MNCGHLSENKRGANLRFACGRDFPCCKNHCAINLFAPKYEASIGWWESFPTLACGFFPMRQKWFLCDRSICFSSWRYWMTDVPTTWRWYIILLPKTVFVAWNTLVFKWSIQSQNFQQHIVNLDLLFASNDFERKQLVGRLVFLGIVVRPYTKQQKHHWGNLLPPVMAGTSKRPPLLWGFQPRPRIGDTQGLRCSCSPFSGKSTYPHCNVPLPEMRPALLNPYFWGGMFRWG